MTDVWGMKAIWRHAHALFPVWMAVFEVVPHKPLVLGQKRLQGHWKHGEFRFGPKHLVVVWHHSTNPAFQTILRFNGNASEWTSSYWPCDERAFAVTLWQLQVCAANAGVPLDFGFDKWCQSSRIELSAHEKLESGQRSLARLASLHDAE